MQLGFRQDSGAIVFLLNNAIAYLIVVLLYLPFAAAVGAITS